MQITATGAGAGKRTDQRARRWLAMTMPSKTRGDAWRSLVARVASRCEAWDLPTLRRQYRQ